MRDDQDCAVGFPPTAAQKRQETVPFGPITQAVRLYKKGNAAALPSFLIR